MSSSKHSPIVLPLRVRSVGALGRCLPPREPGIDVPVPAPLALGRSVKVELVLDEPWIQHVDLVGVAAANLPGDGQSGPTVRVSLDRPSWKRLFATVCRTNWRRRDDFDAALLQARRSVEIPAEALLGTSAPRPATIIEASARGAFLALPDHRLSRGDGLRFRTQRAMSWLRGEVRWTGNKGTNPGVGVLLAFSHKREQLAWTALVAEHQRLAAAA